MEEARYKLSELSHKRQVRQTLKIFLEEQEVTTFITPINWAEFDFDSFPLACSVMFDEFGLFADPRSQTSDSRCTLELFARNTERPDDIDEVLGDKLERIALTAFTKLMQAQDSNGDSMILKLDKSSVRVIEVHDPLKKVQGLIIPFNIGF